jgi:peptidoglycan/xylan/chitin deacetylase (PgdA/CDA1 family)
MRASAKLLFAGGRFMPTVLMYHSIGRNTAHFTVTPEAFRQQMEFLRKHGFEVVTLDECLRRSVAGEDGKLVALTFDDGYVDFIENAAAELKNLSFPATVFLICGKMGQAYTTSDGATIPILSWEQARAVQGGGIAFGSHTMTHPKLSKLSLDEARRELVQSRDTVKKELGEEKRLWLCYPHGRNSPDIRRIAREEGYVGAVTIDSGHPMKGSDPFGLPRKYIHSEMGMKEFESCFL